MHIKLVELLDKTKDNQQFNGHIGSILSQGQICGVVVSQQDLADFVREGVNKGLNLTGNNINKVSEYAYTEEEVIEDVDTIIEGKLTDEDIARHYIRKINNARERNIECTLSLVDMRNLLKRKTCYYTGISFSNIPNYCRTLDRIDSTKGYTKENTVACCHIVNKLKNELFEKPQGGLRIELKHLKKMLGKL